MPSPIKRTTSFQIKEGPPHSIGSLPVENVTAPFTQVDMTEDKDTPLKSASVVKETTNNKMILETGYADENEDDKSNNETSQIPANKNSLKYKLESLDSRSITSTITGLSKYPMAHEICETVRENHHLN